MKLPKLQKPDSYVGLYVVDFGDNTGVGFTAQEVAELFESERYKDCKAYKIHRAYPDGRLELKGVRRDIFQLEAGMFFFSADSRPPAMITRRTEPSNRATKKTYPVSDDPFLLTWESTLGEPGRSSIVTNDSGGRSGAQVLIAPAPHAPTVPREVRRTWRASAGAVAPGSRRIRGRGLQRHRLDRPLGGRSVGAGLLRRVPAGPVQRPPRLRGKPQGGVHFGGDRHTATATRATSKARSSPGSGPPRRSPPRSRTVAPKRRYSPSARCPGTGSALVAGDCAGSSRRSSPPWSARPRSPRAGPEPTPLDRPRQRRAGSGDRGAAWVSVRAPPLPRRGRRFETGRRTRRTGFRRVEGGGGYRVRGADGTETPTRLAGARHRLARRSTTRRSPPAATATDDARRDQARTQCSSAGPTWRTARS